MADEIKHDERSETERQAEPAHPAEPAVSEPIAEPNSEAQTPPTLSEEAPTPASEEAEAAAPAAEPSEPVAEASEPAAEPTEPVEPAAEVSEPVVEPSAPPAASIPPKSEPAARGGGFAFGLIAAVLGGVVALGGQYLVSTQFGPLKGLDERLAALDSAATRDSDALDALKARLAAVDAKPIPDVGPLDARLAKLEKSDAAKKAADRLDKLEAAFAQVKPGAADSTGLADRLAKIEATGAKADGRLAKLEAAAADFHSGVAAATAVAGIALEERLTSGRPYAAEFATLAKFGADAGALAALKPFAAAGAPTSATIAAGFAKVAPALVAPERAGANNVADKLLASFRSLVKSRPTTEVKGDDPNALVSQTQAALERGDVAAALATYAKLPESLRANAAASAWAKDAQALANADAGADAILAAALSGLTKD